MSDAQLACLAIALGPFLVGCAFALGNMVPAGLAPAPSPARVARLCVAGPFLALAFVVAVALELVDDLVTALHAVARRAVIGLRSWMAA